MTSAKIPRQRLAAGLTSTVLPIRQRVWLLRHFLPISVYLSSLAASLNAADISEADRLYKSGKYRQCVEYTATAIEENEYSETWRVLNIRANMACGQYAHAMETLEAALKRYPSSIRLRWNGHPVLQFNKRDDDAKKLLDEIAKLVEHADWQYRNAVDSVVLGRFELARGVDPTRVMQDRFNHARKQLPGYAESYLAIGQLALEKHDFAMAAEQFEQAAKIDETDPDIHFGIARAYELSDSDRSTAALQAALERNPHHVDSLLFMVDQHVDAERFEEAEKLLDRVMAVNPHEPCGWAYRAVLAHLANKPEEENKCRATALAYWTSNPEVDHTIGRKLSQKYRFKEGAKHQRLALGFDPEYLPAKSQLAQDLLRLGHEEEGWRIATEVYERDGYNIYAHNLVTLHDNISKFRTLQSEGFVVRMDAREAALYGQRVLKLLEQAKATLCKKYDVEIKGPVVVEIFAHQQDFAIRTFGMPGGAGFLGVCFGQVITANSPSSQGASPSNWEAVLWHEFCHVVTLTKTNNKMPRWLSEGVSVYEELQANRAWGQSMNPRYRKMILDGELTPVSQLSGAFLRPPSALHLQFAYFQSALVVEYLIDKHGIEVLKRILVDLGVGMPINEALERHTGSLSTLDEHFAAFAKQRAEQLAPNVDWDEPELPPTARVELLAEWLEDHPNNFAGLTRLAKRLIATGKWQEARKPLESMLKLYPSDSGADIALSMLAMVFRELGDTDRERDMLDQLAGLDADAVETYLRLAELAEIREDWPAVLVNARRTLAVNPLIKPPHQYLANAAEHLDHVDLAIEARQALLELEPFDLADAHLQLAKQLQRAERLGEAKRHVLQALEEAPRFRAAHKTLLEIVASETEQTRTNKNDEP